MRSIFLSILLLTLTQTGNSQTFLGAYKKYRLANADTILNTSTRKKIKKFIRSQITELDTIFKSYKNKTNFNFNDADTLFLIYNSPVESPFTSDITIWSGMATIHLKVVFQNNS